MNNSRLDRRQFAKRAAAFASLTALGPHVIAEEHREPRMRFGLVTYMWGHDWDLPMLISNCAKAGAEGVELRTTHAHGVEPSLNADQRREVKARFADSQIKLVGLGSNEDFHGIDSKSLAASVDTAKAFIRLSHDVGSTGVKVKPNDLPPEVPKEQTIAQIGRALNELGAYASDFGQQVRLEVHGGCSHLPTIAAIMDAADHPSVAVCWNSNPQDLEGEGLEHNFELVRKRLGHTVHVHELSGSVYPYEQLFKLLKSVRYDGWVLAEESKIPRDRVAALAAERKAFDRFCG